MKVRDIMTRETAFITEDQTITQAAVKMKESGSAAVFSIPSRRPTQHADFGRTVIGSRHLRQNSFSPDFIGLRRRSGYVIFGSVVVAGPGNK